MTSVPLAAARRPRRLSRLLGALVLAAAGTVTGGLAGCASTIETQVTAFHEAQTSWRGKRFVVVPSEAQRDSLEFRAYADLVSRALEARGLVPAAGSAADVQVRLHYRSSEQRPLVYSSPVVGYGAIGPAWGYPYPYRGSVHFGWYPWWGSYGVVANDYREYRTWRRELRVEMQAPGSSQRLYEGTAFTDGGSDALPAVMPALVEAMFHEFPGPNGQPRRVEVQLREPVGGGVPSGPAPAPVPASPPSASPSGGQPSGVQSPSK